MVELGLPQPTKATVMVVGQTAAVVAIPPASGVRLLLALKGLPIPLFLRSALASDGLAPAPFADSWRNDHRDGFVPAGLRQSEHFGCDSFCRSTRRIGVLWPCPAETPTDEAHHRNCCQIICCNDSPIGMVGDS